MMYLTQGTSIKLKNSETTGTIVGLGPEIAGQAYYIIETDKQCLDSKYPYSHFCASYSQIDMIEKNAVDPSDEELSDLRSFIQSQRQLNPDIAAAMTPEARWELYGDDSNPTVSPAEGEVEKLVKWLKEQAIVYQDYLQSSSGSKSLTRTAELLEKYADLAEDAVGGMKYIESTYGRLYGVGWDRVYTKAKLLSNTEETTND